MGERKESSRDDPRRTAYRRALRALARRPRTRRELSRLLDALELGRDVVDGALERLLSEGLIDDATLALDYVLARGPRKLHGRSRLILELERRGVDPRVARAAWTRAVEEHALDPCELLDRAIQRRLRGEQLPLDPAAYRRVYNAVFRAGFDAQQLRAKLDRYLAPSAEPPEVTPTG